MATDAELAAQIQSGDPEAFTELYGRYVQPVHDFVGRTVRDFAAAEDITQAAFLQAWTQRETLKDPAAVKAWLYRIAHNLALNHVTRKKPTEELEDYDILAAFESGPEEHALSREAADLVWDAAASLEPRQHAVLELSVRQQLTSGEIAAVLDVDNAKASLLVHRARDALGNAVRYLLVARRRTHCNRLAAMVPESVRQLTATQRASVDRHMRRCSECQILAQRLTAPAELLGALLPLSVPAGLATPPHLKLTGAHLHATETSSTGILGTVRRRMTRRLLALVILLLLVIGGGITLPLTVGHQAAATLTAPTNTPHISPMMTPITTSAPISSLATLTPSFAAQSTPRVSPSPTPVPTPAPTSRFAVAQSTLCFLDVFANTCNPTNTTLQNCKAVGFTASWTCSYQVTFALTPGLGGTLAWTMSAVLRSGCGSTTSTPVSGSGTVSIGIPTPPSVTVTGTVTVSSEPNPADAPDPLSTATVTTPQGSSAAHNTVGFFGHHGDCS